MPANTIVIAPDSFKECLPAWEVAEAIAAGWRRAAPDDRVVCVPMADGGEGTMEVLLRAAGGTRHTRVVTGPLGEPVEAAWGVLDDGTAVIEMAAASGLHLVPADRRDPFAATSRGTGEVIAAALEEGCTEILVTLGGSATNDGGAGIAAALGYRFLDKDGNALPGGGACLKDLAVIDGESVDPRLREARVTIACDVTNPLLGPVGASAVFGPQKGATPDAVRELDAALARFAYIVEAYAGTPDARSEPGAGAAGGAGFGLRCLLKAAFQSGFECVADQCGLSEYLESADLAVTGEGRLDGQTMMGKVCAGVAERAKAHGVPCVALAGSVEGPLDALYGHGLTAAVPITPRPMPLDEAIASAGAHLTAAGENLARLWHARGCND